MTTTFDPTTPQTGPPEEPKKKHHWYRPRNVAIGAGALIVVFVVIGVAGGSSDSKTPTVRPVTATSPAATPSSSTSYDAMQGCLSMGGTWDSGACVTETPTPIPTAPAVYHALTSREWAQIAKDPDAHAGETYIVYGEVTQFDAATGDSAFRADVGGTRQYTDSIGSVDYPTNTVLDGDAGTLGPVVEKDLFTAKITVTGSLSYDTQIGGSTTVPELQIDKITVTGHASY